MSEALEFANRDAFRSWLDEHGSASDGVWLLFGKKGGPKTLSAKDALEEALCFGWIDGQIQSLSNTEYKKYFARRIPKSKWSEKNRKLAQSLITLGRMTQQGLDAIQGAKSAGTWDAPGRILIDDEQLQGFRLAIQPYEPAYTHLMSMPLSTQRTYTGFFLDAKADKTRQSRLRRIVDRLNQNLKPM